VTKSLRHYTFSPEQIAKCICKDCGENVIERGDYCMIATSIWEGTLKLSWDDNLCIGCIERRLGRQRLRACSASFCHPSSKQMRMPRFRISRSEKVTISVETSSAFTIKTVSHSAVDDALLEVLCDFISNAFA
jgi:hypothetical protein